MELKLEQVESSSRAVGCSNCTLVELKHGQFGRNQKRQARSNCTLVELKQCFYYFRSVENIVLIVP